MKYQEFVNELSTPKLLNNDFDPDMIPPDFEAAEKHRKATKVGPEIFGRHTKE